MDPIIEKHIGKEAYEEAVNSLNKNQEFIELFNAFLKKYLTETEDLIEDYDTPETLLDYSMQFIKNYTQCRNQGFSKLWSNYYGENIIHSDHILIECYDIVAKVSKELAMKDLLVYCEHNSDDEHYTSHFIESIIEGNANGEVPIEKRAASYSKTYKEQLIKGKSKIYAQVYAELLSSETLDPYYCLNYALIYDESIEKGKNRFYADIYAEKYAHEVMDLYGRGIKDESMYDFGKAKAQAYINAWEFTNNNELNNASSFMNSYESAYLNTLFSDETPSKKISNEELHAIALKKALEMDAMRSKMN